jgi:hypothetical protein
MAATAVLEFLWSDLAWANRGIDANGVGLQILFLQKLAFSLLRDWTLFFPSFFSPFFSCPSDDGPLFFFVCATVAMNW